MNGRGNNNPFGYTEKNVGRNVFGTNTDSFSLISSSSPGGSGRPVASYTRPGNSANRPAGASVSLGSTPAKKKADAKKDTPVRKSGTPSGKQNTKKKSSPDKKAKGDKKKKETPSSDVFQDRISQGRKSAPARNTQKPGNKEKKKSAPKKGGKPADARSREPQGRDTRNMGQHKKSNNHARSNEKYKKGRREGASHDEMVNTNTRRKRKKARLIAIVTTAAVMLFVLVLLGAYVYSNGAPIAVITVEGESRYKDSKILEAANVYEGQNMLKVRQKAVNDAVTKQLPYISEVDVDYRFPETLILNITSTVEKILITNGAGYICVDENDKILSVKKKKLTEGRYRLDGLEKQEAQAGDMYIPGENNLEKYTKAKEIVSALDTVEGLSGGVIDVSDLKNITYTYDGRVRLYLGKGEELTSACRNAMDIISENVAEGQTGYIDMRFDGRTYFATGSMDIK